MCPSLWSSCTGHLSPRGILASPFSMAFSTPSTSGCHRGLWLQQGLPREDSEAKKLEAGSSQQRNCSSFLPSRNCSQYVAYFGFSQATCWSENQPASPGKPCLAQEHSSWMCSPSCPTSLPFSPNSGFLEVSPPTQAKTSGTVVRGEVLAQAVGTQTKGLGREGGEKPQDHTIGLPRFRGYRNSRGGREERLPKGR